MNPDEVRTQLDRILDSRYFVSSERMCRFLRYAVEEALEGRAAGLKETLVGHAVFDKALDYDSRLDPIVRVEARRLRAKLQQYYLAEGKSDVVFIEFPRGSYAPVFRPRSTGPAPAATRTVAVLPFTNLSAEPENAFFSDGLTQEIIHVLTKLPGLRVMAWTSMAQWRDSRQDPTELVRRYQVDTLLEGSVRRDANRVRITVQLVDAASRLYLWSETYERQMRDLLALQEELARSIARVLQIRLTGAALTPMASAGSPDAYSLYLRGRYEWNRRTEEGLRQSILFFERAIHADPRCAVAYAGLADAYSLLGDHGHEPVDRLIPLAYSAATRALEIDPTLAEAHTSMGIMAGLYHWNWEQSEQHYRRAIELNPGYATAHFWYGGDLLALRGRFEEAIRETGMARQLDPLAASTAEGFGYIHMLARRFWEAEKMYRDLAREYPDFHKAYTGLGRVLAAQGEYEDAIEMLERGRALVGELPNILSVLCQVHGMAGNTRQAETFLDALEAMARHRHVPFTCFAVASLGLRRKDEALDWVERSAQAREMTLPVAGVHYAYDDLRGEPRFRAVLERVGVANLP